MRKVVWKRDAIHNGNLVVVNAGYPFREGKNRGNLVAVNRQERHVLLDSRAAGMLAGLMEGLGGWEQIAAVSGWRSMREQQEIYAGSLKENGADYTRRFVALPNHSEHQTGLAIDLGARQGRIDFICPEFPCTGIFREFRKRAASFGFVERYPEGKEHVTGIAHEPWHFRYVGTPHAEIMDRHGMVLEEYMDFLKQYPYGKECYCYRTQERDIWVSYLRAEKEGDTCLELEEGAVYSASGNNMDGYIITVWNP